MHKEIKEYDKNNRININNLYKYSQSEKIIERFEYRNRKEIHIWIGKQKIT